MGFVDEKLNQIFISDLEPSKTVLDFLGDSAFSQPSISVTGSQTHILFAQSVISALATLSNITVCAINGNFSDTFVLVRKLRDDLFQYLFLLYVLSNRSGFSEFTKEELEDFNMEEESSFLDMFDKLLKVLVSGERKNALKHSVDLWFDNIIEKDEYSKERKLFDASKYVEMLKRDELVKECFDLFLSKYWKKNNRLLNNYVHANGIKYILSNQPSNTYNQRVEHLNAVSSAISEIVSMFLAVVILIKPSFIMSDDYVSHLDVGLEPPEDSQYWIAPCIQDFLNTHINLIDPKLKDFLREKNPYAMVIE